MDAGLDLRDVYILGSVIFAVVQIKVVGLEACGSILD